MTIPTIQVPYIKILQYLDHVSIICYCQIKNNKFVQLSQVPGMKYKINHCNFNLEEKDIDFNLNFFVLKIL